MWRHYAVTIRDRINFPRGIRQILIPPRPIVPRSSHVSPVVLAEVFRSPRPFLARYLGRGPCRQVNREEPRNPTATLQNIMSVSPPTATAKADSPGKRTSGGNRINQCGIVAWRARRVAMSARCAAATSTAQERQVSLAPTQARSARDIPSRSLPDTQAHRKDHPASASPRQRRQQDYLAAYTRRSPLSRSSRAPTLKRIILVYPVGDKLTGFLLFISLPHRRPMSAVSPIATKF
jgi:hypothetical protein